MGVFVPIAAAVGGGSALLGGALLATAAVSLYAGVESARMTRQAGKIAEAQSRIDANAEGDAARNREIERKKMLLRAISSQQAQAGAAGVSFSEGSPRAIAQLDIDEAADDLLIDRTNTRARQRALITGGRNARISANAQANISLLDTAAQTARMFM